ncbi:hypothetical protein [Mycobacteroides abscessus]|uniref:hypothetical protein n=1 Tax=Mycobacteroides abscessus TaxID=36809 RepID=UPI00092B8B4B|nr:hypothetical protein [Mycobacteroides abscessus]SII75574.1 Uncharacterised protein [Mycobacteroides abscessus subsp. abscessus]
MSEDKPTDLGSASTHAEALALSHRATEQRRRCTELSGENKGKTINKACERLIAQAQANEQKAGRLNLVSQALKIREEAAARWNRNAPRDSELEAAHKAIGAASEELKRAEGLAMVAAEAKMKAAIRHSADLNERRKQADMDYERAEKRAEAKLSEVKGEKGKYGENHGKRTPGPGTAPQTKPAPGSATPVKPSTAAPAPSTSASHVPNAGTSAQDKSLSDLLVRTGHLRPQQEMQSVNQTPFQQQPQVAPAAASAAPAPYTSTRPDNRTSTDDAIKSSDVPDIPVGMGVTSSPGTTSSGATPSTAQHTPATSGTSAKDLHTDANVTGRAEGPRTFASGATSKLTNTTGFQGSAQPQTAAAHAGMGQPVAAPMGAGASAGTSKSSAKIQSAQSKLDYEEGVVPGGTIAQNRPDRDDDK